MENSPRAGGTFATANTMDFTCHTGLGYKIIKKLTESRHAGCTISEIVSYVHSLERSLENHPMLELSIQQFLGSHCYQATASAAGRQSHQDCCRGSNVPLVTTPKVALVWRINPRPVNYRLRPAIITHDVFQSTSCFLCGKTGIGPWRIESSACKPRVALSTSTPHILSVLPLLSCFKCCEMLVFSLTSSIESNTHHVAVDKRSPTWFASKVFEVLECLQVQSYHGYFGVTLGQIVKEMQQRNMFHKMIVSDCNHEIHPDRRFSSRISRNMDAQQIVTSSQKQLNIDELGDDVRSPGVQSNEASSSRLQTLSQQRKGELFRLVRSELHRMSKTNVGPRVYKLDYLTPNGKIVQRYRVTRDIGTRSEDCNCKLCHVGVYRTSVSDIELFGVPLVSHTELDVSVMECNHIRLLSTVSETSTIHATAKRSMKFVRRYSDFAWLYRELYQLHHFEAVVCPLPPRKLWGRFSSRFLKHRCSQLQHFLQTILQHKVLAQSLPLQVFLHPELETAKASYMAFKSSSAVSMMLSGVHHRDGKERNNLVGREDLASDNTVRLLKYDTAPPASASHSRNNSVEEDLAVQQWLDVLRDNSKGRLYVPEVSTVTQSIRADPLYHSELVTVLSSSTSLLVRNLQATVKNASQKLVICADLRKQLAESVGKLAKFECSCLQNCRRQRGGYATCCADALGDNVLNAPLSIDYTVCTTRELECTGSTSEEYNCSKANSTIDVPAKATSTIDVPAKANTTIDVPAKATSTIDVPAKANSTIDVPAKATSTIDVSASYSGSTENSVTLSDLELNTEISASETLTMMLQHLGNTHSRMTQVERKHSSQLQKASDTLRLVSIQCDEYKSWLKESSSMVHNVCNKNSSGVLASEIKQSAKHETSRMLKLRRTLLKEALLRVVQSNIKHANAVEELWGNFLTSSIGSSEKYENNDSSKPFVEPNWNKSTELNPDLAESTGLQPNWSKSTDKSTELEPKWNNATELEPKWKNATEPFLEPKGDGEAQINEWPQLGNLLSIPFSQHPSNAKPSERRLPPLHINNPKLDDVELNDSDESFHVTEVAENPGTDWEIDALDLAIGTRIGIGNFGQVFDAVYHGQRVAVKKLTTNPTPTSMNSFYQEAKVMRQLPPHPNVVAFYGASLNPFCLVMELVRGGSLTDLLLKTSSSEQPYNRFRKTGQLSHQVNGFDSQVHDSFNLHPRNSTKFFDAIPAGVPASLTPIKYLIPLTFLNQLDIALQAARGLQALHECKPSILHRDLKPANLLCGFKGSVPTPSVEGAKGIIRAMEQHQLLIKVCDFGLSRFTRELNSVRSFEGSASWIAPEVIQSRVLGYTEKADVYSFGIVLWQIMSRSVVYKGLHTTQILYSVCCEGLRPIISPQVHPGVTCLMQRCWHHDPHKRPTFKQVCEELSVIIEEMYQNYVGKRKQLF